MPEISPKAVVDPSAQLAADVKVGAFAFIGAGVKIASGCIIDNNATVLGNTTLGENTHVFPMAVVGTSQDGAESVGRCIIGKANNIREHATICAGTGQPTIIGDDNLIMIGCHIGAGTKVGNHGIFANFTQFNDGSVIEDYVRTSGFALVENNIRVGAYTFISGYAGIESNAPPYSIVQGNPFRVRGANSENLRRCGFGEKDIKAIKSALREMYNGVGQINDKVLQKFAKSASPNPYVRRLAEFIQAGIEGTE